MDGPAQWTEGFPWAPPALNRRWLGDRKIFWPAGVPRQPPVAVVSSRIGRPLESRPQWFARLRRAAAAAARWNIPLAAAQGTAAWPWASRAAWWFLAGLCEVFPPRMQTWAAWLRSVQRKSKVEAVANASLQAWLSPGRETAAGKLLSDLPLRDRALIGLFPRLAVLQQRAGGVVESLLKQRLADGFWSTESVMQCSAGEAPGSSWPQCEAVDGVDVITGSDHASLRRLEALPWLWHCTRAQHGPWPDQSYQHYVDDLLWNRPAADHSVRATLIRILRQQRIVAGRRGYRGGVAAVSLANVHWRQLAAMRRYRAHRTRWDFEPYALGFSRSWLQQLGARPVIYGTDQLWRQLAAQDQPFFQLAVSAVPQRDWTQEHEWRVLGDVMLEQAPDDAVVVLVQHAADVPWVQPWSRWPVVAAE